ncbi:ABC transporter substrate-binding protein [Spiribacter vilamensis]|uniref:Amino acid/amide ABC transporter substrate-binding protein (HAAT family) n=1 Tax=Spiribacter vilamensis TaxID=531306 RepID=A0A4Q8D152_9GAMM|nr:ABC transporter substrate-binding protein [Spiribacter vilamensis]RZU99043.1 amino acid/amide ABC transporter substrate-binding protein (HAAT family) [Spiribacter vilamensis]TVO61957.1 ABC transporter substrate-binding protein [Spiribacter vilamensis]
MRINGKLAGALGALSLAVAAGGAQAELKVGALLPLTGDLQAYGESSRNGINLAASEINEAGGVLGESMAIEIADTQTEPQSGVDAAQRLVSVQGVSAIVGALSSGVTIPVASSVSASEGIPQISGASTSPVMTDLDDNDFLFRTTPSDAFQGTALAEVAADKGMESVGILYINNDYGEGLADAFTESFEAAGGEVVGRSGYEPGLSSYRGELNQVSDDESPLLLIGYPENGQTILRQALEGGHFTEFLFTDGMKSPQIVENLGAQYLNGSAGTVPQARDDTNAAQHFKEAYEATYGEVPPVPYIDTAYDAVYTIALAAVAADSTDPVAIRDHLRAVNDPDGEVVGPGDFAEAVDLLNAGEAVNYEGASGSVNYDENGDVAGTFAHWEIQDGEYVTVRVFEPTM